MILSCCLTVVSLVGGVCAMLVNLDQIEAWLIYLVWKIPMTVRYCRSTDKSGLSVGTGFKICSLLFVSMIAGILMLCDNEA